MRQVILVIAAAVCTAHWLPIGFINREVMRRQHQDAETAAVVSTLPEVESSARLLELYH